MWSLKSSFFSKQHRPAWAVPFRLKVLRQRISCLRQRVAYALSFMQFRLPSFTLPSQSYYRRVSLALHNHARIMSRAYESSNKHLLSKKKNNIGTFGHFSSVRLNYLHANQFKQVQTKWRTASEWYQKKYQCWYVFFSSKLQKERISLFFRLQKHACI